MGTYASSRVKRKSFYRKNELQMVLLISGGHICVPKLYTNMASPYKALQKGAWNFSANNSETVGHEDLRLGQIVYILVFYNISFSWLLPLDGFQFISWRRIYYVTVKTINPFVRNVWSGAGETTAGRVPPEIAINKLPSVLIFICSFS